MHLSNPGLNSKIGAFASALMLLILWLSLRGYHGLTGDGQIYAFQALAKIHPALSSDLYLQNISQDKFTIFSCVYAWFINLLGLEPAARLLTLLFTGWFLIAAWISARSLADRDVAWFAVAFLLIITAGYGGSGVFQIADQFLTARLPAEALIVTSLACYLRGHKTLAVILSVATLFVHPLIALPGFLLLLCLTIPRHVSIIGASLAMIASLTIAVAARRYLWASHLFPILDSTWLNIVQERSQFLFLQLWSFRDWDLNAKPFFYLAFTVLVVRDDGIRNLCISAVLVAVSGLAIALIASVVGPVALLVQGQAWRWTWIAVFVSILLLPLTISRIWRDEKCGPLCSTFLVAGWTVSALDGTACVSIAMVIWVMRSNIGPRAVPYLHRLSFGIGVAMVIWICRQAWGIVTQTNAASTAADQIREVFAIKLSAIVCVALGWKYLRARRSIGSSALIAGALFTLSLFLVPASFRQSNLYGGAVDSDGFSNWRDAIPPTSTVLVSPARDVGAFVWFTLERPNYLTVDQSAGVVFSRATALEVKRRSEVLLPIMEPSWKIMTHLRENASAGRKADAKVQSLTAEKLAQFCTDPSLGFVISQQKLGFRPLPQENSGMWKDWNLYDCRRVRTMKPEK
jgi:hypothetical protein